MIALLGLTLVAILSLVVCFQIALIFGAPWGRLTQGGQHDGALPMSGRIGAAVSIVALGAISLCVLSVAGYWPGWPRWVGWIVVAFCTLSTVLNWITPSRAERRLWGPITTAMLALAVGLLVATRG